MKVNLDKNLDKDVLHTIKTTIGYPLICKQSLSIISVKKSIRLAPFMNVDKKNNDNESFYRIAIWILPISKDIP